MGQRYLEGQNARRMDRFSQFAVYSARQAVEDAYLVIDGSNRDRIGVMLGTGVGGLTTLFEQMQVLAVSAGRIGSARSWSR